MNILRKSREDFSKVEMYLLTSSNNSNSVKNLEDGTELSVKDYLLYETEKDGSTSELLAIMTSENEVYVTQSATFKRSFFEIADIMEGDPFTVRKVSGTSKSGRPFVNCTLKTDFGYVDTDSVHF